MNRTETIAAGKTDIESFVVPVVMVNTDPSLRPTPPLPPFGPNDLVAWRDPEFNNANNERLVEGILKIRAALARFALNAFDNTGEAGLKRFAHKLIFAPRPGRQYNRPTSVAGCDKDSSTPSIRSAHRSPVVHGSAAPRYSTGDTLPPHFRSSDTSQNHTT